MTATVPSEGQMVIPLRIRQPFGPKAGNKLEFDETASILVDLRGGTVDGEHGTS
jgi:bifunctional DNA-binding transcriptional regulator/antitoxin component of YhaV-PrlF toxin-antitoxin module